MAFSKKLERLMRILPGVAEYQDNESARDTDKAFRLRLAAEIELMKRNDGKGLDVLGPGCHTLTTQNLTILTKVLSLPWGFKNPSPKKGRRPIRPAAASSHGTAHV